MNQPSRSLLGFVSAMALAACGLVPPFAAAQTSSSSEQWIHVRVESREDKTETVRVNVPVDMAVKVLPAIKHNEAPRESGEGGRGQRICKQNARGLGVKGRGEGADEGGGRAVFRRQG